MQTGQRLSEARRRRNLTVADIARTTKIPVRYLEAIERDDVDRMPPGFFARAFVRTYANEVGVHPRDILDPVEETISEESEPEISTPPPADAKTSMRSWLFIMSFAAVCAIYYAGRDAANTTSPPPEAPAKVQVPSVDRVEAVAAVLPAATSDVELQIESRGGCIVAAAADGNTIPAQALAPSQLLVLKARGEVILRVGDSGTCAPRVKPDTAAAKPRRTPVAAIPGPAVVTTEAGDPQSTAAPAVEPIPDVSDAVLPDPSKDVTQTVPEQF